MYCKVKENNVKCRFFSEKIGNCTIDGCKEIVSKCIGCENVVGFQDKKYCYIFYSPETQWETGKCLLATNYKKPPTRRRRRF